MVAAGVADEVLVQLAYAIGVAKPVSVFVNTYGTAFRNNPSKFKSDGEIASVISSVFDLRPASIIKRFGLKKPIYEVTAAYGHMGRDPFEADVQICNGEGEMVAERVSFFTWEKLDSVNLIKESFGL